MARMPWNKGKKTGQTPWNKGVSWPQEIRDQIAAKLTGRSTGRKGVPMREWVKERLREANTGRVPWNKGLPWHPEAIEKMRAAKLGKPRGPMPQAQRDKIGAANRGKRRLPEDIERMRERARGRTQSAESREKRRAAMRERVFTAEHRKKLSEGTTASYLNGTRKPPRGKRTEYLDRNGRIWTFRSKWEHDVARQLDEHEIAWSYEPHQILLSTGRRYIPDFWIEHARFYLEVKGRRAYAGKVLCAIADGHPIELLFSNDIFTSPPLVARLGIATKRENHTLELVAS